MDRTGEAKPAMRGDLFADLVDQHGLPGFLGLTAAEQVALAVHGVEHRFQKLT